MDWQYTVEMRWSFSFFFQELPNSMDSSALSFKQMLQIQFITWSCTTMTHPVQWTRQDTLLLHLHSLSLLLPLPLPKTTSLLSHHSMLPAINPQTLVQVMWGPSDHTSPLPRRSWAVRLELHVGTWGLGCRVTLGKLAKAEEADLPQVDVSCCTISWYHGIINQVSLPFWYCGAW